MARIGMTTGHPKLLVVQIAALGHDLLKSLERLTWGNISFQPLDPVFPALTCTAQASFRTAALPARHGMTCNGIYLRDLRRTAFWEQSSALVQGPRIWDAFRAGGGRVAMLFWQQSLGEDVDLLLSPAPIHKHHGGLVQSCYSKPADLYDRLCSKVGRPFNLAHYWGPRASRKSSDWIAEATAALLRDPEQAPDLCLTYLPVLDYDLQRFGPRSPQAERAVAALFDELAVLRDTAEECGFDMLTFGDYAIAGCSQAVLPNLALRKAGLFVTRSIEGALYPDLHASAAFAMVDHEIAHVFAASPADAGRAADALRALPGVDQIMDGKAQEKAGIRHERSGDLIVTSAAGFWFAYPWWENPREAPDYASHVDIHNKPGYDPSELFFGRTPFSVCTDPGRIRGSHGRTGPDRTAAWAATGGIGGNSRCLIDLSAWVKKWLDEGARKS